MPSPPVELLTVLETAVALRRHKSSVFRLLKTGDLTRVKVGGITLIPRSSLDALLAAHTEVRND